jgi:MFS family permease
LVVIATAIFSVSYIILGSIHNLVVLYAAMVLAGIAQLMAFSSCTYVLYRGLPNWVMSRVASVYQLVLQATIVGGTVLWGATALVIEPELEHGPVLVQIEYKIDPTRQYEFALAMKDLGSIRKRDGAFFWGIFRHDTYPDVFIESFLIESWAEHLRQHERITIADRLVEDKVLSFHINDKPPVVSHFIAEPLESMQQRFK